MGAVVALTMVVAFVVLGAVVSGAFDVVVTVELDVVGALVF